jgi:AcrR family transcriptional regulator
MDAAACYRPRVEGDREREIFFATLDLIGEAGYDRLTLDAVAARAKASKATLYRRWASKAHLVAEAVCCLKGQECELPDTGSLRGDLLAMAGEEGFADPARMNILCGLATAMYRDAELGAAVREHVIDRREDTLRLLLERASDRGELRPESDLELICHLIPALVILQLTLLTPGELPAGFITRIIEEVLLPAVLPTAPCSVVARPCPAVESSSPPGLG